MTRYVEFPFPGLPSLHELTDPSNECRHGRLPFDRGPRCGCWNIGWTAPDMRTREERLLDALRAYVELVGSVPTKREWDRSSPPAGASSSTIQRAFGSWSAGLRAAGLAPRLRLGGPEKRFWAAVDRTVFCWDWKGHVATRGYGQFFVDGHFVSAHRFAYELLVGTIPEGMQLDHLCRNRTCVNPAHLEPVTGAVNVQRGSSAKLTLEQVREIHASTEDSRVVAARYGISRGHVYSIRRGRTWRSHNLRAHVREAA